MLVYGIMSGEICYVHFGLPCKSWGKSNRLNGGTRRLGCPQGGPCPLPRELVGNRQALLVSDLCLLLHERGGWFSIENPSDSHVFRFDPVVSMTVKTGACLVKFDQCAYGLALPGAPVQTYCKKSTAILTNIHGMTAVARKCPGICPLHRHEHAWGSRKVGDVRFSLAASAGRYPPALCEAIAACVKEAW